MRNRPQIERPLTAIQSAYELKVGDVVHHVYGIWPPCLGDMMIITGTVRPYRDDPECEFEGISLCDALCFRERRVDSDRDHVAFASDCNIGTDHYNDNYLFRSEPEALAYLETARLAWEADPDAIADVLAERRLDAEMYDDHYDYEEAT